MNLYLKQKLFAIGDKYDFTDAEQKVVYQGKKSPLSLTKIFLNDPNGKELLLIQKKLFAFFPQYTIFKEGKEVLFVKKRFSFKPKFDITDADGNTYELQGNIIGYDFTLIKNNKFIGSVRKKFLTFGDAYELSVDDSYDPALFCALALVIDNCVHNENKKRRY